MDKITSMAANLQLTARIAILATLQANNFLEQWQAEQTLWPLTDQKQHLDYVSLSNICSSFSHWILSKCTQ